MPKDRTDYCRFHHPVCNAGCDKVTCRAMFPLRAPFIMPSDLPMCESLQHGECEQYLEGVRFQEEREKKHKGCPFLSNNECGHPEKFRCNGFVPPFVIEGDNLTMIESCFGEDYKECPNYAIGMKFREDANRIKAAKSNS